MGLAEIADTAGIVSSFALTLSLVYLALQVRQAERNQRGLMQQGQADRLSGIQLRLAEPGLSEVWSRGSQSPESLSDLDLERFVLICRSAFLNGEDSVLQHKARLLDEATFHSFAAGARGQLAGSPGFRVARRMLSSQFGPDFRDFMDQQLSQMGHEPAGDRLSQWRELVQAEAA